LQELHKRASKFDARILCKILIQVSEAYDNSINQLYR